MSSIPSEPGRNAHVEIRGAERQLLIDGKAAKLGARASAKAYDDGYGLTPDQASMRQRAGSKGALIDR